MMGGHELGARLAVHVHELRKQKLDPPVVDDPANIFGVGRLRLYLKFGGGGHRRMDTSTGGERIGVLCVGTRSRSALTAEDTEIARAIAHLAVIAIKSAELIDRLTNANIVKDLFGALSAGWQSTPPPRRPSSAAT